MVLWLLLQGRSLRKEKDSVAGIWSGIGQVQKYRMAEVSFSSDSVSAPKPEGHAMGPGFKS